jgi:uncharacterized protein
MRRFVLAALCCGISLIMGSAQGSEVMANKVAIVMTPFDLSNVRLLDGPFKTAQDTDRAWLLRIDPDRLLYNFRATAGLRTSARPYGGWEAPNCELRGHCLGHYLSACARMFAATGDTVLKQRVDHMVAELAECQTAMPKKGFHKGFLSAYPESLFDRVDAARPVWAPYYTLHKIYAGLLDAHHFCGNAQALAILREMTDWLDGRFGRMNRQAQQKALGDEHGGMAESLAELYARTGEPRYLKLAEAFRHDAVFLPAAAGHDRLTGLHANTQFPKFIGYERIYELTGQPEYHQAARNFWSFVTRDRSFAIGGNSTHESFFPVDKWEEQMKTLIGPETCNTYNMLKLTAQLAAVEPSSAMADFYERALFNHIRSSQHPGDGNFVYYTSLRPGAYRNYSDEEHDFWCCVGTGMENPARYGEAIYGHAPGRIYVNQFIASEVSADKLGGTLRQETTFPAEPRSRLKLKLAAPKEFTIAIRKPGWTGDKPLRVSVNGQSSDLAAAANGYVELTRSWNDGDKVEIELPMRLAIEPLPKSTNFVAVLYGPIVLAGELGRAGMTAADFRGQTIAAAKVAPLDQLPVIIAPSAEEMIKRIEPVAGRPLEFRLKGVAPSGECMLAPFASVYDERYVVYWPIFPDEAAWKAYLDRADSLRPIREKLAKDSVDFILPGDTDNERNHRLHGDKSGHGEAFGRPWRDAQPGGWFQYELKVEHPKGQKLVVTYWGGDVDRVFDVLVNGKKIATQTLQNNQPGEFFDVEYPLPDDLPAGQDRIVVRFQGHSGSRAGGVFGIRVPRGK